jgi:hypothetical protein
VAEIEQNTRAIVSRLKAEGWVRIGGGKHDVFAHLGRATRHIVLPRHREQSIGVARAVAKLAGWI